MPNSPKQLLVGSTEAYSGKSATVLGLGLQLQHRGLDMAYAKPIGTCPSESAAGEDEDVRFITQALNLASNRVRPTLFCLDEETIQSQLASGPRSYRQQLDTYTQGTGEDLLLSEGPGTLEEGTLFELSLPQLAELTDASVLLVARFRSVAIVDRLLAAKQKLGQRLLGVIINDVPEAAMPMAESQVKGCLERHQISVLGILPSTPLMRSVSVAALVRALDAEVLSRPERMDRMMVEQLSIGAMNVNSALRYFRKAHNMAVVTGGDRSDIQIAALETSTQCLILTGHLPPKEEILSRAKDLEVPILSVDLDTLTTVEIIDRAFDQMRLQEPVKVECIQHLMDEHFDIERLMAELSLKPAVTA